MLNLRDSLPASVVLRRRSHCSGGSCPWGEDPGLAGKAAGVGSVAQPPPTRLLRLRERPEPPDDGLQLLTLPGGRALGWCPLESAGGNRSRLKMSCGDALGISATRFWPRRHRRRWTKENESVIWCSVCLKTEVPSSRG